MELKYEFAEGKLYGCHVSIRTGKGKRGGQADILVLCKNMEEAADKAGNWFKTEHPGIDMTNAVITAELALILI